MTIPLVVLAIGSALAGFVGVPHALNGNNWIESFLEPSFEVHEVAHVTPAPTSVTEPGGAPPAQVEAAHAADGVGLERLLMAVSVGIAAAGLGLAWYFWRRRRDIPAALAGQLSGAYRVLLNKYYIDEIYDAVVVQPIKQVSVNGLWKAMDVGVIDGVINGVGATVRSASASLRRLQTGSIRTYAAALFLGAVLILGWYLWA
jgi:NADH-quinone oxidoreductase subunit L